MVSHPGFIDLDDLAHRLLVSLIGCSFLILEEAVDPESAKTFCTLSGKAKSAAQRSRRAFALDPRRQDRALVTTAATILTKEDTAQNCGRLAFISNSWASVEWASVKDTTQCAASFRNPNDADADSGESVARRFRRR